MKKKESAIRLVLHLPMLSTCFSDLILLLQMTLLGMSVLRLLEESHLNVWVKIVQYTRDRMTKFIGKVHSTTY